MFETIRLNVERDRIRDLALIVGASWFLALFAQISFLIPYTPVRLTFGPQAALVVGCLLGPRRGVAAVLAYLLQGACGLPVFAMFGAGIARLVGPSGGYLIGYLLGAYVCGLLAYRSTSYLKTVGALIAGNAMILACGFCYLLSFFSPAMAWKIGIVPFLAPDVVKVASMAYLCFWSQRTMSEDS